MIVDLFIDKLLFSYTFKCYIGQGVDINDSVNL